MDADNVAKPILDALGPLLGHVQGRVADERIARLEVVLDAMGPAVIDVELHALAR
jgi:hypothetical protein